MTILLLIGFWLFWKIVSLAMFLWGIIKLVGGILLAPIKLITRR